MANGASRGGPVTFLNRTYDEAMDLLLETRAYLAVQEPHDRAHMNVGDRLLLTLETTRLTAMLSHIIAWLLTQRAVGAGEIPRDAIVAGEHRLGGRDVCIDDSGSRDGRLPLRLRQMLARGHQLYIRVSRLDELSVRGIPTGR